MTDFVEMTPVNGLVTGVIRPPGSKSLTNRALLVAALAKGKSKLHGVLQSDDTAVMIDSLKRLGIDVQIHEHSAESKDSQRTVQRNSVDFIVTGCGHCLPNENAELFVKNSGTTIRFLTAALGIHGGTFLLDGIQRMRERPIGHLIESLNKLGANTKTNSPDACPPVEIQNQRIGGGSTTIDGSVSSQYLSGLLMGSPLAGDKVEIEVKGKLISKPYVEMTLRVMNEFGVEVASEDDLQKFSILPDQAYKACDYAIEPDASAASYFWASAAICGGTATVVGLNRDALQGDVKFVECLRKMGCAVEYSDDQISVTGPATRGIDIDMADISDTVQTLTSVALFVEGPTRIRNVAHNRVKETDRIGNLAIELRKFGVQIEEHEDGLTVYPGQLSGAEIETYDDHRMAMSLALVGLRVPNVRILDPGCVSKTYPEFFDDLDAFCRGS